MPDCWAAHSDRDFEDGNHAPPLDDDTYDEPHMPLREWLAGEDWPLVWRVVMDDIGQSREGDYPYCLTPWVHADA